MPKVGDVAPDFTIKDSEGKTVHLADYRGKQRVVLYFFPKCFTPGCDIEAGKFRDEFGQFVERSTQVLGVSADDPTTAKKFREHFQLPFPVLPDHEKKIIEAYGIGGTSGFAKRVTFLIGLDGKVELVVEDRAPGPHIEETLKRLKGGS
jgi:thioredoxin-dependent peroxiredoxin